MLRSCAIELVAYPASSFLNFSVSDALFYSRSIFRHQLLTHIHQNYEAAHDPSSPRELRGNFHYNLFRGRNMDQQRLKIRSSVFRREDGGPLRLVMCEETFPLMERCLEWQLRSPDNGGACP
ncbi:hypothetical protein E2C01_041730 [Portunus trituberculatus]|uniref:Uncharacterized protein n=1 Tax=Portunus trituberculatus TaxID=210409 RepID=A0A5B7FRS9_PORTR|nr:hypothetical protein [Portunus trituberculatus]